MKYISSIALLIITGITGCDNSNQSPESDSKALTEIQILNEQLSGIDTSLSGYQTEQTTDMNLLNKQLSGIDTSLSNYQTEQTNDINTVKEKLNKFDNSLDDQKVLQASDILAINKNTDDLNIKLNDVRAFFGSHEANSSFSMGLTSHIAASEYGGVAIGEYATIDPYLYSDVEADGVEGVEGGENIAIGFFATSLGWRDVAIGAYAEAGKVSATAIGFAATAKNAHALVIGRGAFDTEGNQSVIGSSSNNHIYFANGHSHRFYDLPQRLRDKAGLHQIYEFQPVDRPIYLHGRDATDLVDGSSVNIDGGGLMLVGGKGTGSGKSGTVDLLTSPSLALGGNIKNTPETALRVDDNQNEGETRLLLLDTSTKELRRVVIRQIEVSGQTIEVLALSP